MVEVLDIVIPVLQHQCMRTATFMRQQNFRHQRDMDLTSWSAEKIVEAFPSSQHSATIAPQHRLVVCALFDVAIIAGTIDWNRNAMCHRTEHTASSLTV